MVKSFLKLFINVCNTVGEYPPQIHIKPALDVQKMENVQSCLDFLEYYDVSVNGITAEGEKDLKRGFCC